ncbi:hypothetical protein [Corynebacterium casei]|uniref:hypothetical protein n=1 Tax=Corynebacterium casei TaxID=160386 RepID=UPI003FD3F494
MVAKRILDPELFLPSKENIDSPAFWLRLITIPQRDTFLIRRNAYNQFVAKFSSSDFAAIRNPRDIQQILSWLMSKLDDEEGGESNAIADIVVDYSPSLGSEGNSSILRDDLGSIPEDSTVILATDDECWPPQHNFSDRGLYLHTSSNSVAEVADNLSRSKEREKFLQLDPSIEEISEKSAIFFPYLRFCQTAWDQTGKVQGNSKETVRKIARHLCVLNDEAPRIWAQSKDNSMRIRDFGAMGMEASPENGGVLRNSKFKNQRKFKFYQPNVSCGCDKNSCVGHEKLCHWHTKIYPRTGRIHFTVEDSLVYIGTITDHLPLPG